MSEYEEELEFIKPHVIECEDTLFEEAYNEAYNFENYSNDTFGLVNFINGYITANNNLNG